jgi:hypothetical protein
MVMGAASAGLPLAKTPKRRAVQIGFITYFFLFGIFFLWRSIVGYAVVAVVAFGQLVFLFPRWKNST